jgi:hypothetical protein
MFIEVMVWTRLSAEFVEVKSAVCRARPFWDLDGHLYWF